MLLTWKLARAMIDTRYNHPLYQRVNLQAWYSERSYRWLERIYLMLAVTVLIVVALIFGAVYSILLLHAAIFIPLITVFFGGIGVAPSISRAVVRARDAGAYELLCITPGGAIHINWLIATGFIHHAAQRPTQIHGRGAWFKLVGFLVLFGAVLWLLGWDQRPFWRVLYGAAVIIAIVAVFVYVNNVQSLLLAGLVGILIPTYAHRSQEVHVWSLLSYAFLQVITYSLTAIALVIFSVWLDDFSPLGVAMMAVFMLIVLYLLHEFIIALLWNLLLHRLQVTPHEAQVVIQAS